MANELRYTLPLTDCGVASKRKRMKTVTLTGYGGDVQIVPLTDAGEGAPITVTLPTTNGVVKQRVIAQGKQIGLRIQSVPESTNQFVISDVEIEYKVGGN